MSEWDIKDIIGEPRDDWRPQSDDTFVGPWEPSYVLRCGGYRVPYVSAKPMRDGRWLLVVDDRLGIEPVTSEEVERWLPLVANAMAVAAGYSCFGEHCQPLNPFTERMSSIDMDEDIAPPNLDKPG